MESFLNYLSEARNGPSDKHRLLRQIVNQANPSAYDALMDTHDPKYEHRNNKIRQWMRAANLYGHNNPEVYQMILANLGELLQKEYGIYPQEVGKVIEEAGVGFKNSPNPPSSYPNSSEVLARQEFQDIDPKTNRLYFNPFYSGDAMRSINDLTDHIGNAYRSGTNTIENYAEGVKNSRWNPMNWRDPEGHKFSEIFPNEFGNYPK